MSSEAPSPDAEPAAEAAADEAPLAVDHLRVSGPHGALDIPVTVDLSLIDTGIDAGRDTYVIFQTGPVLLVIDGYPSNAKDNPMFEGGMERWLRIIDMHNCREKYAKQVESTILGIAPGHPLLQVTGNVLTLDVQGGPLVLEIADDLSVSVIS